MNSRSRSGKRVNRQERIRLLWAQNAQPLSFAWFNPHGPTVGAFNAESPHFFQIYKKNKIT